MSVTGFMYNINATKKLAELELQEGYEGHHSWHNQFKDSAYVYIGGLHLGMTEGDVIIMFSQFGEIVDVNLIRDKTTGKSKGFCFICYEDQRSTILAVDNMNGWQLLGRTLRVDHVDKYKAPKRFDENEKDEDGDPKLLEYEATGAEGKGYKVFNALESQKKISEVASQRRAPLNARKALGGDDEDEAWAKNFEESLKSMAAESEKLGKAKKSKKELKKSKKDLMEVLKETKRLKKEAKMAKEEAKKRKESKTVKQEEKGAKQPGKAGKKVKSEESTGSSPSSKSSSSEDSSDKAKKKRKR